MFIEEKPELYMKLFDTGKSYNYISVKQSKVYSIGAELSILFPIWHVLFLICPYVYAN